LRLKEIYELFMNTLSPFELQEKWDNAGLLVGNFEDEFENFI
jgi:putative NIF3 family GTP cyclohydrolase 1 type 2